MRFNLIAAAALAVIIQTAALCAQSVRGIHSGRELPATAIIPYESRESALAGEYGHSAYLQPLKEWTKIQNGTNTEYTTEFKKPFAWVDRLLILHLDGAGGSYNVYVNGKHVGWNQSGMTPSGFDVTKYAVDGNNSLKIEVLGNDPSRILENRQGSGENRSSVSTGLVGDSYIYSPPKVRVRDFVTNTSIVPAGGVMEFGLIIKSALLNTRSVRLSYELLSPKGELVSEGYRDASIDMRREDTIRFLINVPQPKIWSHENPELYTVVIKNMYDGRYTEYLSFKMAFVNINRQEGKLVVNGTPLNMVAVEYEPGSDMAVVEKELVRMKQQGVNTLKINSTPQSEPFYRLCDRLGLYVCAQADINTHRGGMSMQLGGNPSNDPHWGDSYKDRVEGMYHTSKSHPSVVMFSLAENSANGICLYDSYLAIRRMEKSRPVVYIGAKGEWNSDAANDAAHGLIGFDGSPRILFRPVTVADVFPVQAFDIEGVNTPAGIFAIFNNMQFTSLSPAIVEYNVMSGRKKVASGTLKIDVSAESRTEFAVPLKKSKPGETLTYTITVTANGDAVSRGFTAVR